MKKLIVTTMAVVLLLALVSGTAFAAKPSVTYNPTTPSQLVACKLVDNAIAMIPHGDGISPVEDSEVGPGGWRYSNSGGSFVTFAYTLNIAGDSYDVVAGRSNAAGNAGTINDYPAKLDLTQSPESGAIVFSGKRGEIVLTGDTSNDPPLFALPGKGAGQVRINMHDPDGDGIFEGCAKSPLIKNFGFVVPEGGNFVQQEYFKAYAVVDGSGTVTFYEWTEISTFNNTVPGSN